MSRIHGPIAEHFLGVVKLRQSGEMLDSERPSKYIVASTEYDDNHTTPDLTVGQTSFLGTRTKIADLEGTDA